MPDPSDVRIERLRDLPTPALSLLVDESEQAGLGFVRRLGDENAPAARLYERLGFRRCGDVPDCTHLMELR